MARLLVASLLAAEAALDGRWHLTQGSFTEYLKNQTLNTWREATEHPMTDAIGQGTVPHEVMRRYLIQDHKFIDAFVVLLSSMIAHASNLEDRIPGAQFLGLITSRANTAS